MFKESPFYTMHELLLGNMTLEGNISCCNDSVPLTLLSASPSHRQNATKNLVLDGGVCARLRADSMMRVLLFCAAEQPTAPFSRVDVAFPSQIEVRINNDEVKANYKGLKNKPGSTRPVDVTRLVRTNPANYRNTVLITYALTQKASAQEVSYPLFVSSLSDFTNLFLRSSTSTSTWRTRTLWRNFPSASRSAMSSPNIQSSVKVSVPHALL